jgi:hypothetical protein
MANYSDTIAAAVSVSAGRYNWAVYGTWGGTSAQLQWSPDGTTWIDIDSVVATENGGVSDIPIAEGFVRTVLTGGTSPVLKARLGVVR